MRATHSDTVIYLFYFQKVKEKVHKQAQRQTRASFFDKVVHSMISGLDPKLQHPKTRSSWHPPETHTRIRPETISGIQQPEPYTLPETTPPEDVLSLGIPV